MVARNKHGVPCLKSIAFSSLNGPPPEGIKVSVEAMEYARMQEAFIGVKEARDVIKQELELISLEKKGIEEGLNDVVKRVNEVLRKSQER